MGLFSKLFGKSPEEDKGAAEAARQARIAALAEQKRLAEEQRKLHPEPPKEVVKSRHIPIIPSRARNLNAKAEDHRPTWERIGKRQPTYGLDLVFAMPPSVDFEVLDKELKWLFGSNFLEMHLSIVPQGIEGTIHFTLGDVVISTSQEPYSAEIMASFEKQMSWEELRYSFAQPEEPENQRPYVPSAPEQERQAERLHLLSNPHRLQLAFDGDVSDEFQLFDLIYLTGYALGEKSDMSYGAVNVHAKAYMDPSLLRSLPANRAGLASLEMPDIAFWTWTGGLFKYKLPNGRIWFCTQGLQQFRLKELAYCDAVGFEHIAFSVIKVCFWAALLEQQSTPIGTKFMHRVAVFRIDPLHANLPIMRNAYGAVAIKLVAF